MGQGGMSSSSSLLLARMVDSQDVSRPSSTLFSYSYSAFDYVVAFFYLLAFVVVVGMHVASLSWLRVSAIYYTSASEDF